ncbi:hypothetical protein WA158_004266, partial [Blastocystis sp. Blastoise]
MSTMMEESEQNISNIDKAMEHFDSFVSLYEVKKVYFYPVIQNLMILLRIHRCLALMKSKNTVVTTYLGCVDKYFPESESESNQFIHESRQVLLSAIVNGKKDKQKV